MEKKALLKKDFELGRIQTRESNNITQVFMTHGKKKTEHPQ
jgi:hypothetical protein